jgi:hypothetical protein
VDDFFYVFTSVQFVAVFGMLALATLAQEQHILPVEHHVEEDHYVSQVFVSLYILKNDIRFRQDLLYAFNVKTLRLTLKYNLRHVLRGTCFHKAPLSSPELRQITLFGCLEFFNVII